MAYMTYSDISAFVNTVFEDALFVARDQEFMTRLVTLFNDRQGMAVRQSQIYGTAVINSVGETDDLVGQTLTPSSLATLTPGEVAAQFPLTDQRLESDPFGVRQDAALELGRAMGQKIETDILGNFSSLTGGTVGSANNPMTWGIFFAALSRLRTANAPQPYVCVLHPYQWHDLGTAVTPAGGVTGTNAPGFQDEVLNRFWVGRVSGVEIYTTSNIATDANDDAVGAMFSRPAIAFDIRRAPRLEPERDASKRLWELNLSAIYGHGVWRPAFGIQIVSDVTAPTS